MAVDFRVVPWIPLVDAHGIDRAYSLDGIGKPAMVQIKTSGSLDEVGRYHWTVRVGSSENLDGVRYVGFLRVSCPYSSDDWGLGGRLAREDCHLFEH